MDVWVKIENNLRILFFSKTLGILENRHFVLYKIILIFEVLQPIFIKLGMYVKIKETFFRKKKSIWSNFKFQNSVHFKCLKMTGKWHKTIKIAKNNFI